MFSLTLRDVPSNYEMRLRQFIEKLASQHEELDEHYMKKLKEESIKARHKRRVVVDDDDEDDAEEPDTAE